MCVQRKRERYSQHCWVLWHFFLRKSFFGQLLPPSLAVTWGKSSIWSWDIVSFSLLRYCKILNNTVIWRVLMVYPRQFSHSDHSLHSETWQSTLLSSFDSIIRLLDLRPLFCRGSSSAKERQINHRRSRNCCAFASRLMALNIRESIYLRNGKHPGKYSEKNLYELLPRM